MTKSDHQKLEKQYHHGNLRQALIDAGLELIAEGGISQIDLRKVARKVGVSHMAPYRHFSDRNELLAAIAEEGLRKLADQVRYKLEQVPDDFLSKLDAFAKEYVNFAITHPQLIREMFSGINTDYQSHPAIRQALIELFEPLVSLLKKSQATPSITNEYTQLTLVIWSMIHGFSTLVIENFNIRNALQSTGILRKWFTCACTLCMTD
jgi:AcrR family transcriptional regulator